MNWCLVVCKKKTPVTTLNMKRLIYPRASLFDGKFVIGGDFVLDFHRKFFVVNRFSVKLRKV